MDRRVKKTKRVIRQSFLELMEEKGLDKVTVRDLTIKADINRGTFYLHYTDIHDLLTQMKQEIFKGIKQIAATVDLSEIKGYAEKGQYYPNLLEMLKYIAANFDFFRIILSSKGDPSFPLQMKAFIKEAMYEPVFLKIAQRQNSAIPIDYLIAFITSAQLGVITHWVQTEMNLTAEELAQMITQIIYRGPLFSPNLT